MMRIILKTTTKTTHVIVGICLVVLASCSSSGSSATEDQEATEDETILSTEPADRQETVPGEDDDPYDSPGKNEAGIGAPCQNDKKCGTGLCLDATSGWSDGYCSEVCSGDCPGGARCVQLDEEAYCLDSCGAMDPCRQGYVCNPIREVCMPDCREGWQCKGGYTCNDDGHCELLPTIINGTGAAIGESCEVAKDCVLGLCLQETNLGAFTGWSGGYCSALCTNECPNDATCIPLGDASYCLSGCEQTDDCRDGYVCNPYIKVCLPDCRDGWECGDDYICTDEGLCDLFNTYDTDSSADTATDSPIIGDTDTNTTSDTDTTTPTGGGCTSDADCVAPRPRCNTNTGNCVRGMGPGANPW